MKCELPRVEGSDRMSSCGRVGGVANREPSAETGLKTEKPGLLCAPPPALSDNFRPAQNRNNTSEYKQQLL